jgi:hypothetical protein
MGLRRRPDRRAGNGQEIGYSAMFLVLGSFALGSVALWLGFASILRPACARRDRCNDLRVATALAGAR